MMLPPIDVACCNRWCMLHFSHVQRAFQQLPPPHNEMEPFPFRFLSFRCDPLRSSDIKRLRSLPQTVARIIYILLITNIGDWVARQQKCNGVRKFLPLHGCTSIDRLAGYPILYAHSTRNWDRALHSFSHTAAADSFFCATGNEFRPIILQLAQFLCTLFPIPWCD